MATDLKFLGVIVAAVFAALQALKLISARLRRIETLREQRVKLGLTFVVCYEIWQQIYRIILYLLALIGLAAIVGFIGKWTNAESLKPLEQFFGSNAISIIIIWFATGIVAYTNIVSYLLLGITAILFGFRVSPSWINALWFCTPSDDPVAIVIGPAGVSSISDWTLGQIVNGQGTDPNAATKPANLSDDERANAALLGCILEKKHYDLKWDLRSWNPFYDCLTSLQMNGHSLFNPEFIRQFDHKNESFFEIVRDGLNQCLVLRGEKEIPESADAATAIENAIIILKEKYDGSAATLARSRLPFRRSLDMGRAFRRAKKFPCLDNDSMRPQCLKLMLVWDVWPNIQPGAFIYPFASNLATFLLEKNVLITFDDVDKLSFKKKLRREIYRQAMRRIVQKVTVHLTTSTITSHVSFRTMLQAAAHHPLEWEIARKVDFLLWSHSDKLSKEDRFTHWRLNEQRLTVRKT